MTETTLQEAAAAILTSLSEDYHPGYMPHVIPWCKFVTEYTTEYDFHVDGVFDRVYKKPHRIQYPRISNLDLFMYACQYGSSMTESCLRVILNPDYIPVYCVHCGTEYIYSDGANLHLCDHCYENIKTCCHCGTYVTFDEDILESCVSSNNVGYHIGEAKYRRRSNREQIFCKDCTNDGQIFIKCDCCGEYVYYRETGYGKSTSSGRKLRYCMNCINDGAVLLCNNCNSYVLKQEMITEGVNGHPRCIKCHVKISSSKKKAEIHSHTYKPRLIFASTTPVIEAPYGIEIEVDDGRHSDELMEYLEELKEMLKLKSDGSLNNGFEIVTCPASLDFHRTVIPYEEMFQRLNNDGFTSQDNSTCGIHIHMGRTGFGTSARSQNPAIGRFIWVMEAFKEKFKIFSRRREYRYCQFYGYSSMTTPKQMLIQARSENRNSRYKSVNLQNAGTIEVRIFKGSLKRRNVLASLELCDYIRKYVTTNKDDSKYTSALTWDMFIAGVRSTEYPNLKEYLLKKRLI